MINEGGVGAVLWWVIPMGRGGCCLYGGAWAMKHGPLQTMDKVRHMMYGDFQ